MNSTIRRFGDLEAMSQEAASYIAGLIRNADRFSIALSGGNTPKRLYGLLPDQDIDWNKVHLFLGDERYVPPTDPRSNEKMIRETLVRHIDIPASNVYGMYDSAGWRESADRYDAILRSFFAGDSHTFDLALQGMGDDGHTASIFPGEPATYDDRWVITTDGPTESPQRISASLDCLAAADLVLFMVDGAAKASRLAQVIRGEDYPSAVLAGKAKNVEWWVDDAAARELR